LLEIDRGAIIRVDDFLTPLGALAQIRRWERLEHRHVMVVALLFDPAETQRGHPTIAKIAGVEVGNAELATIDQLIDCPLFILHLFAVLHAVLARFRPSSMSYPCPLHALWQIKP